MYSHKANQSFHTVQAIYHGKPVVAMPFFGDQPDNADRVVAKVTSVLLDLIILRRTKLASECRLPFHTWLPHEVPTDCYVPPHYTMGDIEQ